MKVLIVVLGILSISHRVFSQAEEKPFVIVETTAEFPGGAQKLYEFIGKNFELPKSRKDRVEGKMYVEFIVSADGHIYQDSVRVINSEKIVENEQNPFPGGSQIFPEYYKSEIARVLSSSPQWIPGKRREIPIGQRMVLPITFRK